MFDHEEFYYYVDRFWAEWEYPQRQHLLSSGGLSGEVRDIREDIADAMTRIAWESDKGMGYGGMSMSDVTPSTDISGGADDQFGISVNGDAVEQVILADVATLNTAALIVAAINTALKSLTGSNNKAAKAYYYGGRYFIAGPVDTSAPGTEAVVVSDGLANNVADDLKLGLANGGTEELGSLSQRFDSAGGGSASTSKFGSGSIADAATTLAVVFTTPMPDTSYAAVATAVENTVGLADVNCWINNKTVNGFDINIAAAPGPGNSVDVDWVALR